MSTIGEHLASYPTLLTITADARRHHGRARSPGEHPTRMTTPARPATPNWRTPSASASWVSGGPSSPPAWPSDRDRLAVPVDAVVDLLVGPIHHRAIVLGEPVDDNLARRRRQLDCRRWLPASGLTARGEARAGRVAEGPGLPEAVTRGKATVPRLGRWHGVPARMP